MLGLRTSNLKWNLPQSESDWGRLILKICRRGSVRKQCCYPVEKCLYIVACCDQVSRGTHLRCCQHHKSSIVDLVRVFNNRFALIFSSSLLLSTNQRAEYVHISITAQQVLWHTYQAIFCSSCLWSGSQKCGHVGSSQEANLKRTYSTIFAFAALKADSSVTSQRYLAMILLQKACSWTLTLKVMCCVGDDGTKKILCNF